MVSGRAMTDDMPLRWTCAARTDVGLVRSRNEDAMLALPERGLWAVADGMGGHAYGDVASATVVDALRAMPPAASLRQSVGAAGECLRAVNRQLRQEALRRKVSMMGSTVAVLLASGAEVAYLWAGDSRIYLYRHARLRQLSRDHSQVAAALRAGAATRTDGRPIPPNQITRAVGAADALDLEQGTLVARDGDMFLLCSDGLSNPVAPAAIAAALASGECAAAADELIAQALANGGRDNIAVVVVRADDVYGEKTVLNPAL